MTAIHIVLFVLTSCLLILCDVITAMEAVTPVVDFVKLLKQDLRRNNDDYVESTMGTINVTNPYLLPPRRDPPGPQRAGNHSTPAQTPTPPEHVYKRMPTTNLPKNYQNQSIIQRRNFDSQTSEEINNINENEFANFASNESTKDPVGPTTQTFNEMRASARTQSAATKFRNVKFNNVPVQPQLRALYPGVNNDKIDKMKTFINDNKELFNEFLIKKRADAMAQAERARQAAIGRVGAQQAYEQLAFKRTSIVPDQLDMAPAKGGRVHVMRIRDRLCQRNVLVPEGPKYDSKGNIYLPAYKHHEHGKHDYARTRSPELVLPRCCNCCKKSVLGCE